MTMRRRLPCLLVAIGCAIAVGLPAGAQEPSTSEPVSPPEGRRPQTRPAIDAEAHAPSTEASAPEETPQAPEPVPAIQVEEPPKRPDDSRVREAREAFKLGAALARGGQWLDALAAFSRSASLRPHPVTTYNLAYTERALARYTRASKLFEQAIAEHGAARGGRMPPIMLTEAKKYLEEVKGRLARAHVTLNPPGATIAVDGRPLEVLASSSGPPLFRAGTRDPGDPERPSAASFDILLDPGNHVFVVRWPKGRAETVSRAFEAGGSMTLALSVRPEEPPPKPMSPLWMWGAYGVGAAGLATGAAFGIATLVIRSDLDDTCATSSRCPRSAQEDIDRARNFATVANIGLVVGVAGAAVGTYLLLTSEPGAEREPKQRPAASRVEPWVSVGAVGAQGMFW